MPRFNVVTTNQAAGRVRELYDGLKKAVGKKAGQSEEDTIAIRRGSIAEPRLSALVRFVGKALQPAGQIADADLRAIRAAGFSDGQITEILMVLAQTVFTTLFNRVNQTEIDFPAAPVLQ